MSSRPHYPHADLTKVIIGAFYEVYNALGSGFREVVYERALTLALHARNVPAQRQVTTTVWFKGCAAGQFRADVVVDQQVLLELKALPSIEPSHVAQTLNALRATKIEVGLLLNFGPKPQIKRLIVSRRSHG